MTESTTSIPDKATRFINDFEAFKERYHPIKQQVLEQERHTAPRFNIFDLLGVAHYEVQTHSAFLAHLLDPSGSHGQQHLFLRHFFTFCHHLYADFPIPNEGWTDTQWQIQTEKPTRWGRLDIVISCPMLGFVTVIENKVEAGEQAEQLTRYSSWLDSVKNTFPTQALIYLTPSGSTSSTAAGRPYYRLSYRAHIAEWLTKAAEETAAPRVQETVQQYVDLVRYL